MFTRISKVSAGVIATGLLVAGCGLTEERGNEALAAAEKAADKARADDGLIACAVSGATEFARVCQIEQSQTGSGLLLTVRHPDGGFRRLQVVKDGRGVIAADGADVATVKLTGAREIEVHLSGDQYRLPATVKAPPTAGAKS
jgi:hypothetical protein